MGNPAAIKDCGKCLRVTMIRAEHIKKMYFHTGMRYFEKYGRKR